MCVTVVVVVVVDSDVVVVFAGIAVCFWPEMQSAGSPFHMAK